LAGGEQLLLTQKDEKGGGFKLPAIFGKRK
jgi:hypothetical protein